MIAWPMAFLGVMRELAAFGEMFACDRPPPPFKSDPGAADHIVIAATSG